MYSQKEVGTSTEVGSRSVLSSFMSVEGLGGWIGLLGEDEEDWDDDQLEVEHNPAGDSAILGAKPESCDGKRISQSSIDSNSDSGDLNDSGTI